MKTYKRGFERLGIDLDFVRRNTSTCPKCSHTRKKKSQRCLSINLKTGNYNCNHCDFKGRIDSDEWILKGEGFNSKQVEEMVQATKNELKAIMKHNETLESTTSFKSEELTEDVINWFWNKRKISEKTLVACGVQVQKDEYGKEWIAFNNSFEGEILNAKYRAFDKKFKSAEGVQKQDKHLYGIDHLKGHNTAIIVEGEIDKLSLYEVGLPNCVSITMGAQKPPKHWKEGQEIPNSELASDKLIDIKNDIKILRGMRRVIIAVDGDMAGKYLCQMLLQLLGKDKCLIVDWGTQCKDANEMLTLYRKEDVLEYISSAKHLPIKGVIECEDVYADILDIQRNGHKKGIKTGIRAIDNHFSFVKGWWNLITGIPNSGKSEFMLYIMCVMSYTRGWKWAIFSAEHYPAADFYIEVMERIAHKPVSQMSAEETNALAVFVQQHFYYVYFDAEQGGNTLDNVLNAIATQIILKDIDAFLIDPFNQLDVSLSEIGMRDDKYLQLALGKVDTFCKRYDVCGTIIAHPTKLYKGEGQEDYPCPNVYNISGGAMWNNKAYIVAAVHRPFNQSNKKDPSVDFNVQKVKSYKRAGSPENCELDYLNGWYVARGAGIDTSPLCGATDYLVRVMRGENLQVETAWGDMENEETPF